MLKPQVAGRSPLQRGASLKRPPMSSYKEPVSQEVLDKLVAGTTNSRDRAIILSLMDTAARLGELVSQDRQMIKVGAGVLGGSIEYAATSSFPAVKSMKQRTLYIPSRALDALNLYLDSRVDTNPALFVANNGERLRAEQVRNMVYKTCARLGIERFPIRDFRKNRGMSLAVAGADVRTICTALGCAVPASFPMKFFSH